MDRTGTKIPRLRKSLYLSSFVIVTFTCTALLLFVPVFDTPMTLWRGYRVLLVDGEAEIDPVLDSLETAGIAHVSPRNTRVHINVFSGKEVVPLSAVASRLEADDPRFDPYVQSIDGYFSANYKGKKWHALYLMTEKPGLLLVDDVRDTLNPLGIEFVLPERRAVWLLAAPFGLYGLLFLIVRNRKRAWNLAFAVLPLSIVSLRASGLGLAAAFFLLPGFSYLFENLTDMVIGYIYNRKVIFDRRRLLKGAAFFFSGLIFALLLSVFHVDPGGFRGLTLMTAATLAVWAAAVFGFRVMLTTSGGHRIFLGIPLLQGTSFAKRGAAGPGMSPFAALLLTLVVLSPALVLLSRVDFSLHIASPAGIPREKVITSDSLAVMAGKGSADKLPNLSDYVTHRAFQDSLLYGRDWIFPEVNGSVSIARYRAAEGIVVAERSRVLSFDGPWFEEVISDAADDGLGGMLLAQGGGVLVEYRGGEGMRGMLLLRLFAIGALIIVPLVYTWPSLTLHRFYGMRNLPLRRKRQTA
jgi:hypothetical protein